MPCWPSLSQVLSSGYQLLLTCPDLTGYTRGTTSNIARCGDVQQLQSGSIAASASTCAYGWQCIFMSRLCCMHQCALWCFSVQGCVPCVVLQVLYLPVIGIPAHCSPHTFLSPEPQHLLTCSAALGSAQLAGSGISSSYATDILGVAGAALGVSTMCQCIPPNGCSSTGSTSTPNTTRHLLGTTDGIISFSTAITPTNEAAVSALTDTLTSTSLQLAQSAQVGGGAVSGGSASDGLLVVVTKQLSSTFANYTLPLGWDQSSLAFNSPLCTSSNCSDALMPKAFVAQVVTLPSSLITQAPTPINDTDMDAYIAAGNGTLPAPLKDLELMTAAGGGHSTHH